MATENPTLDLINDPVRGMSCREKVTSIRERQLWKLETEKHGRLFAIDLLRRMHQGGGIATVKVSPAATTARSRRSRTLGSRA